MAVTDSRRNDDLERRSTRRGAALSRKHRSTTMNESESRLESEREDRRTGLAGSGSSIALTRRAQMRPIGSRSALVRRPGRPSRFHASGVRGPSGQVGEGARLETARRWQPARVGLDSVRTGIPRAVNRALARRKARRKPRDPASRRGGSATRRAVAKRVQSPTPSSSADALPWRGKRPRGDSREVAEIHPEQDCLAAREEERDSRGRSRPLIASESGEDLARHRRVTRAGSLTQAPGFGEVDEAVVAPVRAERRPLLDRDGTGTPPSALTFHSVRSRKNPTHSPSGETVKAVSSRPAVPGTGRKDRSSSGRAWIWRSDPRPAIR